MKPHHYTFTAITICLIYLATVSIIHFKNSICQNKFGPEFNARRRALKIPVIPSNWHIKQQDDHFTWWIGKELVIGHESKRVVNFGCEIDEEKDDYFFDIKQVQDRYLEITHKFTNSIRKQDSTTYSYQIGDRANLITKEEADSIFRAEKMNTDL